jgi:site-specific DNA-methyltransferase (adenine-specific)
MINAYVDDVTNWYENYNGPKFHGVLTDPPYHLGASGFMGNDWDRGDLAFQASLWEGIRKHLYPGAFMLVFAGAYNVHRVTTAIEAAGFIIYPQMVWIHAQGMGLGRKFKNAEYKNYRYGRQSLKPSNEPIVCAMNPLYGTHEATFSEFGTGAFDVGASMVGSEPRKNQPAGNKPGGVAYNLSVSGMPQDRDPTEANGRYPANVIMSHDAAVKVGEYCGSNIGEFYYPTEEPVEIVASQITGAPSVFYAAKPRRKERDAGLEDMPTVNTGVYEGRANGDFGKVPMGKNPHATVKPISLTRHLAGLIKPPAKFVDASLLVTFSGVGSEVIGAAMAGWNNISAVEMREDYMDIAMRRARFHVKGTEINECR